MTTHEQHEPPGGPLTTHEQHLRIAASGHEAALRGDHHTALSHYREAMHLAVRAKAPEVFFRHYLEAMLESLELMGAFDDVLAYCDRAISHYAENPPAHPIAWLDLAHIHQRRGVILLKTGDTAGASTAFTQAIATAERGGGRLELAARLRGWLQRGLVITPDRLFAEQRSLKYFSVRPDSPAGPAVPPSTQP